MTYLRQRSSNVADFRRVPLPESDVQLVVGHQASALPVGELTSSSSIGKRQYTRRTAVELERTPVPWIGQERWDADQKPNAVVSRRLPCCRLRRRRPMGRALSRKRSR